MLAELLDACSPDAQGTDIQKMKKNVSATLTTTVSHRTHAGFSPLFLPPCSVSPGPPTRSRLEEQLMGVLQPHDQQRSQSADELQTKPREGLCGMSHTTSIRSPEADWVTEQCSGNITKTLLNFCLSLSLSAVPSLSPLVCPLPFPTPPLLS